MRRSLRDVRDIERHLEGDLSPEENADFKTRLILDPEWAEQVDRQRTAYRLIRSYGRRKLHRELELIHERLMDRPSFREKIQRIFKQIRF